MWRTSWVVEPGGCVGVARGGECEDGGHLGGGGRPLVHPVAAAEGPPFPPRCLLRAPVKQKRIHVSPSSFWIDEYLQVCFFDKNTFIISNCSRHCPVPSRKETVSLKSLNTFAKIFDGFYSNDQTRRIA